MMRTAAAAAAGAVAVVGCASTELPQRPAGHAPALVLENYFAGESRAYGVFEDRFRNLRRQFVVDVTGRVENDQLGLDERFRYDDGATERRVWRIRRTSEGYEGRADDIIGVARGRVDGSFLSWKYQVNLKMGDGAWKVTFDDRMWLQPDGVLINRAYVSRWGVTIGSVTIVFRKPS
jgi:hypothetical protein